MSEQLELWEQPKQEVSLEKMDAEVSMLRMRKEKYEAAKKVSNELYAEYQEQQSKVGRLLESAGKTEYICEGVGKVTVKEMLNVTTPKTPEQKAAFFQWIKDHMGMDAYYSYMSVNSQSLNRLFREKSEEYAERGEQLTIEGLDAPTTSTKVGFTRR